MKYLIPTALCLLLLTCGCRSTDRANVALPDIESWLDDWHERRGFEGFVLVTRGDEILFAGVEDSPIPLVANPTRRRPDSTWPPSPNLSSPPLCCA